MNSNSLFPDLAPLIKRIKSNPKSLLPLAVISILLIALYFLENDILNELYSKKLAEIGQCDTIIALIEKKWKYFT